MSCIGIQKLSGFGIQERIKASDKHFRWDVLINDLIDPFKYLPWFHCSLSHGPQNTACGCHHKCGRYPLIGHVSYHKTESTIVELIVVIKVTTHWPCSLVV